MSFNSNDRVPICNSLYTDLTPVIKNCLKPLCKSKVGKNRNLSVIIVPLQKQINGCNCGLFASAFVTDVLKGLSSVDSCFDVSLIRSHLPQYLEIEELLSSRKPQKGWVYKYLVQSGKKLNFKGLSKFTFCLRLCYIINAKIYPFKVTNRNSRTFSVNFEYVSCLVLAFLLLKLNMNLFAWSLFSLDFILSCLT